MLEKLEHHIELANHCELEPPDWSSVDPNRPPDNSIPHEVREGQNWVSIANDTRYEAAILKYRAQMPRHRLDSRAASENRQAAPIRPTAAPRAQSIQIRWLGSHRCGHPEWPSRDRISRDDV